MRLALVITLLSLCACGRGVDVVCGVPYRQLHSGVLVERGTVAALPMAAYATTEDGDLLQEGGFSAMGDASCQFGVRGGQVYR